MTHTGVTFLGVDLAWAIGTHPTAVAVLQGDHAGAELVHSSGPLVSQASVVDFLVGHAAPTTVVAIDASLVVKNEHGQRPCETLVGKRFGAAGASCHSTNLAKRHAQTGMRLVEELRNHGFRHDLDLARAKGRPGRWVFEVYPHPAMVQLWKLPRIISYKKGRVADKRAGLCVLQGHLQRLSGPTFGLRGNDQLAILLGQDPFELRGQQLKNYEDSLDALFCAYLAWYCWRWGAERNEMIGTLDDGYIVVPSDSSSRSWQDPTSEDPSGRRFAWR